MSKKLLIVSVTLIIVGIVLFGLNSGIARNLVSPQTAPTSTPNPPQAPKTFKFDSSTNLKQELESINPQVLDSDFE